MLQVRSISSPVVCGEAPGRAGCPPAARGVSHQSRSPCCSLWWSSWIWPEGGCSPWRESPHSRLWARSAACGEELTEEQELPPVGDPCWSSLFRKDCTPWYGPLLEKLLKNCSLWEACPGPVQEGLCPVGGAPCWSGADSDREGAMETNHSGLTTAPIHLHCSGRGGGRGWMGGRFFLVYF